MPGEAHDPTNPAQIMKVGVVFRTGAREFVITAVNIDGDKRSLKEPFHDFITHGLLFNSSSNEPEEQELESNTAGWVNRRAYNGGAKGAQSIHLEPISDKLFCVTGVREGNLCDYLTAVELEEISGRLIQKFDGLVIEVSERSPLLCRLAVATGPFPVRLVPDVSEEALTHLTKS